MVMDLGLGQIMATLMNRANEKIAILQQIEADAQERIDAHTEVKDDADKVAGHLENCVRELGNLEEEMDASMDVIRDAENIGIDI